MYMPIARRWLACLFVLPWLAGCSPPTKMLTRPQVITVTRDRYIPVPHAYIAPIPAPPPPPKHCRAHGRPAVCVLDALAWIEAWRGIWRKANADRAAVGRLAPPEAIP